MTPEQAEAALKLQRSLLELADQVAETAEVAGASNQSGVRLAALHLRDSIRVYAAAMNRWVISALDT